LNYAQGQPISWKEGNKIKSFLQNSANYRARAFNESNEAYKQVASLIKNGIDEQAEPVLANAGGDIQHFRSLRGAYGKLETLVGGLNKGVATQLRQPSTPEAVMSLLKKALPATAGTAAVYETMKHLMR